MRVVPTACAVPSQRQTQATCSKEGVCGVSCFTGYVPASGGGSACVQAGPAACGPGMQLDQGQCRVCPVNTFKAPGTNSCQPCPGSSVTLGNRAEDHDDPRDCAAGGLSYSRPLIKVGTTLKQLADDFDGEWLRALNNTGPKKTKPGKPKNPPSKVACLYACDGVPRDTDFSERVAHIAGSPDVFFSNNRSHVRSGANLVSAVRNQGACSTCVSHALASATETAVAAARRIDASPMDISHTFSYVCAAIAGSRSCGTGWNFKDALDAWSNTSPAAFAMNSSCLRGVEPITQLGLARSFCDSGMDDACKGPPRFRCSYRTLSDGLAQIQRHIRQVGSVVTSLLVSPSFLSFFQANSTGIYNGTIDKTETANGLWHAVQLIGYNNLEGYWLAKNSWGSGWGDQGLFRIAYNVADVGHPEYTFALTDCFTTSSAPETVAAWLDPWPVSPDPQMPGCHLYTATAGDTVSGIADHFMVPILDLIENNTRRSVITTELKGDPAPRREPQLEPAGGWAGKVFQVCGIPPLIFDRVATMTTTAAGCTSPPPTMTDVALSWMACPSPAAVGTVCSAGCQGQAAGNATATCTANGTWATTNNCEVQRRFTLSNQDYLLQVRPKLNWNQAQKRCEQENMRLARLYSQLHVQEVNKQVQSIGSDNFLIGLYRRQDSSFVWVGGNGVGEASPLTTEFERWGRDQPDNRSGQENCVEVWIDRDKALPYAWNDLPCDVLMPFLCSPSPESTDPCVKYPCSSGGQRRAIGCTASDGPGSINGRQCSCGAGWTYVSNERGCQPAV